MMREKFILIFVIFLALVFRLYKIDSPLADHHSWRQADTAAVARNFLKEGFDLLQPRIDNMAPLASANLPNTGRLFLVEPPIYQTLVAVVYKIGGVQEKYGRLVSVFFSLGRLFFLYLLVKAFINPQVALLSAFFAAVLPYSIFYSRVILPEPMMIFASLGMIWFYSLYLKKNTPFLFVVVLFFSAWALSLKSYPLFLIFPMLYLTWRQYGLGMIRRKDLWLLAILAILPLIAWRLWISQYPEGIPPSDWLFNQGGIRLRPAFFRWIFAERIGKLILGYWGLPLFVLGLVLRPARSEGWFFHWWMVAFLAYVTVFAAGNVTHDYYQVPFLPLASIFLAKGSYFLLTARTKFLSKTTCYLLLVTCLLFMLGFSWFEVRGFYNIQGGVDLAGRAVAELTPDNSLVLTGDSNDATLLYNTNRRGWTGGYASNFPNTAETIEEVRKMGATVYVTTKFEPNSEFGQYMLKNYPILKQTDQFVIFSL